MEGGGPPPWAEYKIALAQNRCGCQITMYRPDITCFGTPPHSRPLNVAPRSANPAPGDGEDAEVSSELMQYLKARKPRAFVMERSYKFLLEHRCLNHLTHKRVNIK